MTSAVLLLCGLHRATPQAFDAWAAQGAQVVAQHDWVRPLRGDWLMQLENAVLAAEDQVQLVAHGLGCWLVASWAQFTAHTSAVQSALLIDPLDLRAPEYQAQLPSWQRIDWRPLPFTATVLSSPELTDRHNMVANTMGLHATHHVTHHAALARAWGAKHQTYTEDLHTRCMKEETHGH